MKPPRRPSPKKTKTIAFESVEERKRVEKRARELHGNYGFSRYARGLFNADLQSAQAKR